MLARIHKPTLLIMILGALSIFAASISSENEEEHFKCKGGSIYNLANFNAVQEEEACFTFNALLSAEASGLLSVTPLHHILPIKDLNFIILSLKLYPKGIDDGLPRGIEGYSMAGLEFDNTDGLAIAPAPLSSGYYVGNPDIWKEPGGNPLLLGCTNYRANPTSNIYNECRTSYRLKNGDTLFYSISGIKSQRPSDWSNIDKAVRNLIEAAEEKPASHLQTSP